MWVTRFNQHSYCDEGSLRVWGGKKRTEETDDGDQISKFRSHFPNQLKLWSLEPWFNHRMCIAFISSYIGKEKKFTNSKVILQKTFLASKSLNFKSWLRSTAGFSNHLSHLHVKLCLTLHSWWISIRCFNFYHDKSQKNAAYSVLWCLDWHLKALWVTAGQKLYGGSWSGWRSLTFSMNASKCDF